MTTTPLSALPPRTLADQNMKITWLTVPPAGGLSGLTVTELNAGLDASCRVAKDGTRLAPTSSDTTEDAAVCQPAGAQSLGKSNYEASVQVFRFFDETNPGAGDPEGDALFADLRVKGSPGVFVIRHTAKRWDAPWAAGDEYQAYQVASDNWQPQSDQYAGYIKAVIPLVVEDAELNGVVAAAG